MLSRRGLSLILASPVVAQSAPLRVLGTGATETPIEQVAHAFTRETGRVVQATTGNGGQVAARIRAGEPADVVLNAGPAIDALIRDGFATARQEMGRMRLGVAIRAGSTAPDLSSEVELGRFLRGVASIGISDAAAGATSGQHVLALLERLQVPAEAAGGPRRDAFARGIGAVRAVAQGDVTCVITQISEILAVPEATLVAPLPEPLQLITPYVAAIPTRASDPAAAALFIRMAAGPVGQSFFRAIGFSVG